MFERLIGIILPVFLVIALGFAWGRCTDERGAHR
jgi:predicted permease